jgi:hypothetical protein
LADKPARMAVTLPQRQDFVEPSGSLISVRPEGGFRLGRRG